MSVASVYSFTLSASVVPVLMLINLRDDAYTMFVVYGQLAGAYYGEEGILGGWIEKVAMSEHIIRLADRHY